VPLIAKTFINAITTGGGDGTPATAKIEYDVATGRVTRVIDGNVKGAVGAGNTSTGSVNDYVYNAADGSTTVITRSADGTEIDRHTEFYTADFQGIASQNKAGDRVDNSYSASQPAGVAEVRSPLGHVGGSIYDAAGNPVQMYNARKQLVTMSWQYMPAFPKGLLMSMTESTPNVVQSKTGVKYDYFLATNAAIGEFAGFVKKISTLAPGAVGGVTYVDTLYTYTPLGNVKTITTPSAGVAGFATVTTTFEYQTDGTYTKAEALGQPVTVTDAEGNVQHYRYDALGRTIATIDPMGNQTDYAYNTENQLTQVTYPASVLGGGRQKLVYTYTEIGKPAQKAELFDANGTVFRTINTLNNSEWDPTTVQGNIRPVTQSLNPKYQLSNVKNANGVDAHTLTSRPADRAVDTFIGGDKKTSTADAVGALKDSIDPKGGKISTVRDTAVDNRLTGIDFSSGLTGVRLTYDDWGRVTQKTDAAGTVAYTYDDLDKVLSVTTTYPGITAKAITYTYYPNGQRATMTTPGLKYTYYYDKIGRLNKVAFAKVDGTVIPGGSTSYTYDKNSRITKITQPAMSAVCYTYDGLGRVKEQINLSNITTVTGYPTALDPTTASTQRMLLARFFNVTYDPAGNRTGYTFTIPAQKSVATTTETAVTTGADMYYIPGAPYVSPIPIPTVNLNGGGAVAGASALEASGSVVFTYNQYDELVNEDWKRTNDTQYKGSFAFAHNYDGAGNATTLRGASKSFNAKDQISDGTFDANGNLTAYNGATLGYDINDKLASLAVGATTMSYGYRSDGIRYFKQKSGGSKVHFLYDGSTLIAELDATGNVINNYVWGASGLTQRVTGTQSEVRGYSFDVDGNLLHRHLYTSTPKNLAVSTTLFDGYGTKRSEVSSASGGVYTGDWVGYKGQFGYYTDNESGLIYCQQRYYDPVNARWIERDPLGLDAGVNTYLYVGGDPILRTDISGLDWLDDSANFFAGYGDVLSFGATHWGRKWLGQAAGVGDANQSVDLSSGAYHVGQVAGYTHGFIEGGIGAFQVGKAGIAAVRAAGGIKPAAKIALCAIKSTPAMAKQAAAAVRAGGGAKTIIAGIQKALRVRVSCFAEGTLITIFHKESGLYETIGIEKIVPGMEVASRNPITGKLETKPVTEIFTHFANELVRISVSDASGNVVDTLTGTPEHSFLTESTTPSFAANIVPMGALKVGDRLPSRSGTPLIVSSVEHLASQSGTLTYNFAVGEDHTYFVGSANGGIWVHNECVYEYLDAAGRTIYVGIAQANGTARASQHGARFGSNMQVIVRNLTRDEARQVEQHLINTYGRASLTTGNLHNLINSISPANPRFTAAGIRQTAQRILSGTTPPYVYKP
jgi:RHS repeat-associated protein